MNNLDVTAIKKDFPILNKKINGHNIVYLDNAATTQKPQVVIDTIKDFYENYNANVHRGIHTLSEQATDKYEQSRDIVAKFINARTNEIIFTKSATEGLNIITNSLKNELEENDEILLTELEHHSNIVPWHFIKKEKNVKLKYIEVKDNGELDLSNLESLVTQNTKVLSLTHVSNVTGVINDVSKIIKRARLKNPQITTIVDASQSAPHLKISTKKIDADYIVFSAHKMLGPTGVGVLWGKYEKLENLKPLLGGGSMISKVTKDKTTYAPIPQRFEAGTPNIAGVIGFAESIKYLGSIGRDKIVEHEKKLTKYALDKLIKLDFVELVPPIKIDNKLGVISFNVKNVHPHDTSSVLDTYGIAVRSGHHCAQILHNKLKLQATSRISFYIYNDTSDIDKLVKALNKVNDIFNK